MKLVVSQVCGFNARRTQTAGMEQPGGSLSLCGFSTGLPWQRGLGVPFLPAQDSQSVYREKDSSGRD